MTNWPKGENEKRKRRKKVINYPTDTHYTWSERARARARRSVIWIVMNVKKRPNAAGMLQCISCYVYNAVQMSVAHALS